MPVASFQEILDKALAGYSEQIGIELDKHPSATELRGRDSPDDVLNLLEDKAKAFQVYRDGNRKLINWLSPVVQVIHTLSGVLGEAVSLVPFQPAKAIFVGLDVLITVRIPLQFPPIIHLIRMSRPPMVLAPATMHLSTCLNVSEISSSAFGSIPISP